MDLTGLSQGCSIYRKQGYHFENRITFQFGKNILDTHTWKGVKSAIPGYHL
jgi:hypothetical protein